MRKRIFAVATAALLGAATMTQRPWAAFWPAAGALYSYGSGHACDPYDPFTALYGYCGGPYHYRR